jgi:signal transduction histidine kinase
LEKTVRISVSDSGPGIPLADQARIFDPYYRGSQDNPNIHKTRGLGVGLSYVRQATHAHGGNVMVQSTPPDGATFIIELPKNSSKLKN